MVGTLFIAFIFPLQLINVYILISCRENICLFILNSNSMIRKVYSKNLLGECKFKKLEF